MKVLSLPMVIALAFVVMWLGRSQGPSDPNLTAEGWFRTEATSAFWPGVSDGQRTSLRARGVPADALGGEIWSGLAVQVPALHVMRREVSRDEYAAFLAARADVVPPTGWDTREAPTGTGSLPVTNVSLADAQAYAASKYGRLPTELEWERAMRGAVPRSWSFGESFDRSRVVAGVGAAQDVGTAGAEIEGVWHASGNVAEWTTSPWKSYDGTDLSPSGNVVVRGGSFASSWHETRLTSRRGTDPSRGHRDVGFRLVKSVL